MCKRLKSNGWKNEYGGKMTTGNDNDEESTRK
jgi:hypothetical protein